MVALISKQQMDKVIDEIAADGMDVMNRTLLNDYTRQLQKSVSTVYSDGEHEDMQSRMAHNVANFATDKAFCATQQVLNQLHKTGGDIEAAKQVLRRFNSYLATECNTATARARTAKQWDEVLQEDRVRLFPNLRWIPSRSANPREAHQLFWHHVWAKDDPFWTKNFPGNIWNCKCDIEETSDEPTKRNPKGMAEGSKGASGLGTRPDKGVIFDDTNVYHTNSPAEKVKPSILAMGDDAYYVSPVNNRIKIHPMHTEGEIVGNMETAKVFLDNNPGVKEVKLLPNVVRDDERFRPSFYPEGSAPRGKNNNADAVVEWNNGKQWVVDFKCMPGNGVKIIDRLNDAYEQADYAIIKVQQLKTEQEDKIHRWFMQHRSFKGIFVYVEEMLRVECTR